MRKYTLFLFALLFVATLTAQAKPPVTFAEFMQTKGTLVDTVKGQYGYYQFKENLPDVSYEATLSSNPSSQDPAVIITSVYTPKKNTRIYVSDNNVPPRAWIQSLPVDLYEKAFGNPISPRNPKNGAFVSAGRCINLWMWVGAEKEVTLQTVRDFARGKLK